jgi:hypothetical protein
MTSPGVSPDGLDVREVRDQLDGGDGVGADGHEIAEHPPPVDADRGCVGDDGLERVTVSVNVRDQAELHRSSLPQNAG